LSGVAPPVAAEFKISRPPAAKRQPNKVLYCVIEEKIACRQRGYFGAKRQGDRREEGETSDRQAGGGRYRAGFIDEIIS
jgi:hypothetical protein